MHVMYWRDSRFNINNCNQAKTPAKCGISQTQTGETKMIGRVQVAMFLSYETLPYHGVQKKQSVVALSPYEAEYIAASQGAYQDVWLQTWAYALENGRTNETCCWQYFSN